jgi:hypothetical protein
MFRNGIKHLTVLFSLFQLASASVASFVNITYESQADLYDAILNTFFPIFFVIFLNASGKSGSIKNVVLPLLDDLLYNMITWIIPLIVSFAYDDMMNIKIFSIINMCLHVICAALAIIKWKRVSKSGDSAFFGLIFFFLILFPVIVIPIFWIIVIAHKHPIDSIFIIFFTLFGICLVTFIFVIVLMLMESYLKRILDEVIVHKIFYLFAIICFYAPNILQTLLIALSWPINFYFVKACVFILVLSLTRNVSYFADKVPGDLLATSTTMTQCFIRSLVKDDFQGIIKEKQISMKEMHEKQKEMQAKIDEMQAKMNEMEIAMDEKPTKG